MPFIPETGLIVPGANTYASVAQADAYLTYHAQRVSWTALSTPDKEAALVQAARAIDSACIWKGQRMLMSQPMEWPRQNVMVPSPVVEGDAPAAIGPAGTYYHFPTNAIPGPVLNAQIELAALMMQGDRTADSDSAGIKSLGLGKGALAVEFDPTTTATVLGRIVPFMLRDYTDGMMEGNGKRLVKVYRA